MYKNRLNQLLQPFMFLNDNINSYAIVLKEYVNDLDKWNTEDVKLKPVKKFLEDNNIITYNQVNAYTTETVYEYPFIYTTKISKSWFDSNKWNFYLNGQHAKTYNENDIKFIHFQGYIYICCKEDITITSLTVIRTNIPAAISELNSAITDHIKGNHLDLPYDNNFVYKPNATVGKKLSIYSKYISIRGGENLFGVLERYTNNPLEWLYENKIKSYLLMDDHGLVTSSEDVTFDPLFISVKSGSKVKVFLFYDGVDPDEFTPLEYDFFLRNVDNYYLEGLYRKFFKNNDIKRYLLSHPKMLPQEEEINVFKYIHRYDELLSPNIVDEVMGFSYDLFMDMYKTRHRTKINFSFADCKLVDQTKYSEFEYDPDKRKKEDILLKLFFINYYDNPFEIYIFGVLYMSTYIVDKHSPFTDIYINVSNILDQYNIDFKDLKKLKGHVVLKSHDYKRINYNNIDTDFNGTLPISDDLFTIKNKKVYDNGFLLKESDYELNTLHPSGLLCMWPKRKHKRHLISVIGNRLPDTKIYSKMYSVKAQNLDTSDLNKKTDNWSCIYKNLLYVDYIDYRYNLYIDSYMLIENYDYIILAPNLIEFIRPITVNKEHTGDYIDIKVEYEGELEDWMLKVFKYKSYRYRLFNDTNFMDMYYDTREETTLRFERDDTFNINDKGLYDNEHYRFNQMTTKYFSSENLNTAAMNKYGEELYYKLHTEFPEFVTKVDNNFIITDNIKFTSLSDIPRRIFAPERVDLQELITKHIESVKIMKFENKHLNNETDLSDINYRYKSLIHQGDLFISSNIPLNYLLDK
nr:MAG TPA: hypothetical protein [Caudoviricetes sp.]